MKFHEKLLAIRKKQGLSQEELGLELQVSRQTISKWESGQSYPDFEKLVKLSDYFGLSLDELVKDVDVQDVRDKNRTDEKVAALHMGYEQGRNTVKTIGRALCIAGIVILGIAVAALVLPFVFPAADFFWQRK